MQWRSNGRATEVFGRSALIITSPIWIVAVAMMAVLYAALWLKQQAIGPRPEWSHWFAWRPVKIGRWHYGNERWVWLETVERKCLGPLEDCAYRAKDSDHE